MITPNRFSGHLGTETQRACSEVWLSPEVSNLISWVQIPAGAPPNSLRSVHLLDLCRTSVQKRQKLGVMLMLLFMPINGPLWRMGFLEMGYEIPLGEFQGFVLTLLLFVIGAAMVISPRLQPPTE